MWVLRPPRLTPIACSRAPLGRSAAMDSHQRAVSSKTSASDSPALVSAKNTGACILGSPLDEPVVERKRLIHPSSDSLSAGQARCH